MIARLIELSIARRGLVAITALALLIAGALYLRSTPVDAIPDLSDVQVIVYTDYPGQAPQVVEDQVTYPLVTDMLCVPQTCVVRGQSMFGTSFVYVIFREGTDLYWARSRVLERLSAIQERLPTAAKTELGLTHNETRSWHGWHRHVSLVMLAFAMMAVVRQRANALSSPPKRRDQASLRRWSDGPSRNSAAWPHASSSAGSSRPS